MLNIPQSLFSENDALGFEIFGDALYEARLVNKGDGTYKGYPLEPEERPRGIHND